MMFFLKGFLFGFSAAAPVGAIGILCMNRTLREGRSAGLAFGMGVAIADAAYAFIAAFGLTIVTDLFIQQKAWLNLFGGLFLCAMGIHSFFKRPVPQAVLSEARPKDLWEAFLSGLLVTASNAVTILAYTAVFAGLGIAEGTVGYVSPALLVAGVFLGSAFWWVVLSVMVDKLRSKLNEEVLRWVNRAAGLVIFGFGIYSLWPLVS